MRKLSKMHEKMRGRNRAMLIILLSFVILMAVATYVKMSGL